MAQALEAALAVNGPVYLRISRNAVPVLFNKEKAFKPGKARKIRDGRKLSIFVSGVPTWMAMEASDRLAKEKITVDLLEISTIKPLDEKAVVEEHSVLGGLGGAVAECLGRKSPSKMDFVGIGDTFTESGPYDKLLKKHGISVGNIVEKARKLVGGT